MIIYCLRSLRVMLARRSHNRTGAALARVGFGLWLASYYLQSFSILDFIWGEHGPFPHAEFLQMLERTGGHSLLTFSASPVMLNAMWTLGLSASICLIFGIKPRFAALTSAVLLWSFHERNPTILDGGDNLGRIVLMFMIPMCTAAHLSLRRAVSGREISRMRNMIHNAALLAVTFQFCMLYGASGLAKANGSLWQNGTAIYYVLMNDVYAHPFLGPLFSKHFLAITIASYATIALQVSFPFLVWSNRWRIASILGLISMHIGIGYLMGLVRFSLVMSSGLAMLLPDEFYRGIFRAARRLFAAPELPFTAAAR